MTVRKVDAHVADVWERISDQIGDQPALIHGDRVTLWAAFEDRAARLASALAKAGIGRGSTVAIDLYNCSEWIESFFAAIKLRAMPANVNYRYLDDELVHLLGDCKAEALIYHASLADRITKLRPLLPHVKLFIQVADDSDAPLLEGIADYEQLIATNTPAPRIERGGEDGYLSYTGGTTGLPKGVVVQFARLMSAMPTAGPMFNITAEESSDPVGTAVNLAKAGRRIVVLPASPLMHSTGFTMTSVTALLFGGTVVLLPSRSFDGQEACATIERESVQVMAIVGDAIGRPLLRAMEERHAEGKPFNLASMRVIVSAGVAWSADTKRGLFEYLPEATLLDACGASEGSTYGIRANRKGDNLSGTNFMPAPGLKVQDESGTWHPAAPGMTGLLANRTASLGYFDDPEKSAKTFFMLDGEQHVMPGDFGRIEEDGSLTLIGRKSSMINTGGEKVHAEEVEDVLRKLEGVEDCLVFGMPEERFGQQVTALVHTRRAGAMTSADIITHAKKHLAHYKAPRLAFLVDAVPRGPNGKPDYGRAKEMAASLLATREPTRN